MKRSFVRVVRRAVSTALILAMLFTTVPAFALQESFAAYGKAPGSIALNASPPADRIATAIEKFTDAVMRFTEDTSQLSEFSSLLTRFGGMTSAASGAVTILQMTGIIKDPTREALGEIIDGLHDIQDQLNQMDNRLTVLRQELMAIAVAQEEKDRAAKALTMQTNWNDFDTNYCEPLDKMIRQY